MIEEVFFGQQHNYLRLTDTKICFILISIKRLLVGAPGDVCLLLLAVAKKNTLCVLQPKRKQGRGNFHTVTRPAFIQWQLVPPSGKAAKGQSKTGYTFGHAKSVSAPAPSTNWERLITISRSDLSNPSPAPEAQETTFQSLHLTAHRITAFL